MKPGTRCGGVFLVIKVYGTLIQRARELRKNATPWENKLWYEFLRTYPIRFQRQKVIDNCIVDFYCAKAKLAIELDGGGHYTPEKQAADERRTARLRALGVDVLRFSNLDVGQHFYEVCTVIDNEVKAKTSAL